VLRVERSDELLAREDGVLRKKVESGGPGLYPYTL
jgi:hypothetical protein